MIWRVLSSKVGKTWYKMSEEMLAWPQAQYSCMNMQGEIRPFTFHCIG